MRTRWESAQKEREWGTQLANLAGIVSAIPTQMRSIARETVLEVLREQATATNQIHWHQRPVILTLMFLGLGSVLQFAALVVLISRGGGHS